jgi:hypothetical protein
MIKVFRAKVSNGPASVCWTQKYPRTAVRAASFEFIEVWYNRQILHPALCYLAQPISNYHFGCNHVQ